MAQVKILVKGYTSADAVEQGDEAEKTCATVTLVKDKNVVMVVDPGVLSSQQVLVDALNNEGLKPEEVNIVCLTHSHIDHFRNLGLFPKAKVLEYFGLWHNDTVVEWPEQFTDDIKIVKTPGHDRTGISLLVKTDKGVVAVCGDVFWKENLPVEDTYASNPEQLKESRKMILASADWIVPGHGDIYKV